MLGELRAEAQELLSDAAEDGVALKPRVDELLRRVTDLKARADQRDWRAEAELSSLLVDSEDFFWKLRSFAVLNNP